MKKLLLWFIISIAVSIAVQAQTSGCCCNLANASAQVDSYLPSTSCLPAFPDFVVPTSTDIILNKTCSTKCGEVAVLPPLPSGPCGSVDYKPSPANFTAAPIKGSRAMLLSWTAPCPADAYLISRCTGTACSSFALLAAVPASTSFVDGSPELKWNTDYTYRIIAKYVIQGDSAPTSTTGNTGDLECESQVTTDSFCVSSSFYDSFKTYLQTNGYAGSPATPASAFTADFTTAVTSAFFAKLNKGYACDTKNKLTTLTSCGLDELCVAKGTTPTCITPTDCTLSTGTFGFDTTLTTCEGTSDTPNYCFLDKSATPVDQCYPCSQAITCYDYKTKSACERNNCYVGACEWRDTYPDVGSGVCIDARFNSCPLCNKTGSASAPNKEAYNSVFDQCSPEKASALSTPAYPCFYSNGQALDCSKVTCKDYTPLQCGSPEGGITLDTDNNLITTSTDPCGIKVCQYDASPTIQCRKNADATPASTYWPDCALNDTSCERDYFVPATTLIPVGSAGKYDYLNIRIWEKSNGSDFGHLALPPGDFSLIIGAPNKTTGDRKEYRGFTTSFCANPTNATPCTSFVTVNSTQLNINDLSLQDGTKLLFNFTPGWNTLRYFTRDPANNLEAVKTTSIFACKACQGPKVLNYSLTPGNLVNGTLYTRSFTPLASVSFNEPAQLVFSGYVKDALTQNITASPGAGFNLAYTFAEPSPPLAEGTYVFSVNSRDTNNVFMTTPLSIPLVVDITPPTASYTPAGGTLFKTGTVPVTITFNEPVLVQNFTIVEYFVINSSAGPVRYPVTRDITKLFVAGKNNTYTASLTLTEGKKILVPIVTDYAGNPLAGNSSFVVNALPPVVTIIAPPYGASSTFTFPLAFATDSPSTCKYWSSQTLPPPGSFSALNPLETTDGYTHTKSSFSEITKEATPYKIFVRCEDTDTGTGSATFWLTIDTTSPKIVTAYASPTTIVQYPLQTTLKVSTDDLSVCKYSPSKTSYDEMEFEFPYHGILGLISHAVNVTVPDVGAYTYKVACKNVAGLGPASATIPFTVDLSVPLNISSTTPAFVGNLTVPLSIETNKNTYCYYVLAGTLKPFGDVNKSSMAHVATIPLTGPGPYSVPVFCSTGADTSPFGIEERNLTVTFFVDLTPPWMIYADDTSNNPEFPQYSYFLDRLKIAFLGADNESNVSRYHYRIEQKSTGAILKDWTPSVTLTGKPWYVIPLNLTNGNSYFFRVTAENRAGLASSELPSDGVTIDITKIPPHCINGEFDEVNETDIDCGLACKPCDDYLHCKENIDCVSRICENQTCQPTLCDDSRIGGNETDIDCGGGTCETCNNGKACATHNDCASNYCEAGVCTDNPCFDGILDGLESDVDCGGACITKCNPGQTCVTDNDCIKDSSCVDHLCSTIEDEDKDGIPDARDNCPGTPPSEPVDEFGCSASQRHSCGDEIDDAWRITYFGDILCEGDASAVADPDDDNRNNLKEYRKHTNPLVPDGGTLLWILLSLLLLILVLGYVYNRKHPGELKRRLNQYLNRLKRAPSHTTPAASPTTKPTQPAALPDWLTVEELKKLGPEDVGAKTFDALHTFVKGQLPTKQHGKFLKKLEQGPLDKLRELALAGLSPAERKRLLEQLRLLRKGQLTTKETEELFRKLRITADYYKTHKDQLERELAAYTRGERIRRKKQ